MKENDKCLIPNQILTIKNQIEDNLHFFWPFQKIKRSHRGDPTKATSENRPIKIPAMVLPQIKNKHTIRKLSTQVMFTKVVTTLDLKISKLTHQNH